METLHGVLTGKVDPEYSPEEAEFLAAMDRYKRVNQRPYPTWREVLAVVRSLGYRRVEAADALPRYEKAKAQAAGRTVTAFRGQRPEGV